ncbi:MAG: hypothetical protein GY940_06780, partial [bacterium]|nr:hypothetical protein [bacterium]
MESVSLMMAKAKEAPSFPYPWDALTEEFEKRGLKEISFVGYGSLLNAESAARTLKGLPYNNFPPVISFGVRRIFNYRMPPYVARYGHPKNPMARAALNVRFTGEVEDAVNGLLVKWPLDNVAALCSREAGYDLIPTACLDWNEIQKPPFIAYILRSPDGLQRGKRFTDNDLTPHHQYYKVCRQG